MTTETSHNGYGIKFDFGTGEWCCDALGIRHERYSVVKQKINAWDIQVRRVPNIPAMLVRYHGEPIPVTITTIETDGAVWVKYNGARGSRERSKERLRDLLPNTPEVITALAKAKDLQAAASRLGAEAHQTLDAIPRFTIEELREIAGNALDEVANG